MQRRTRMLPVAIPADSAVSATAQRRADGVIRGGTTTEALPGVTIRLPGARPGDTTRETGETLRPFRAAR